MPLGMLVPQPAEICIPFGVGQLRDEIEQQFLIMLHSDGVIEEE